MTDDTNWIPPASPAPPARPGVIIWYYVYCAVMVVLGLLAITGGLMMILDPRQFVRYTYPAASRPPSPEAIRNFGIFALSIGAVIMPLCAAAFFIPRKPWAWLYHLVVICLGLATCYTLIFSIPLLIFWLKPETKAYFRH